MNISKRNLNLCTYFLLFAFFLLNPSKMAYMDAPHPWQVGFQDPATPIMEGIISFNGLLMTFMLLIACFVGWLLYQSLTLFNEQANKEPASFNHSTLLEVVWTIIPAGILMIISIPSYNLLYAMEEVIDPSLTIKVVGHQWYWSYECSDFEVAPKVTGENLELIEKSVKNLKDWVELVESHELGDSKKEIENPTTLINKLGLNKGNTYEHVIDSELESLKEQCKHAEKEFQKAGVGLGKAKADFKTAGIDVVAARANKASAETIKARVELLGNNSSFRRGHFILENGYKGWDNTLRVKTKEISEVINERLIRAEQELKSASSILNITSTGLNLEELNKAKTIANSSESEFIAFDRKVFPVSIRLEKATEILKKADSTLETFSSISNRAEKKLEKAYLTFNDAKSFLNKKYVESVGSNAFVGSDSFCDSNYDMKFNEVTVKFDEIKNDFNRAENWFNSAEEELLKVYRKLKLAESHANDIEASFKDTLLIETEGGGKSFKNPVSYFDNFLWERYNEDLLGYETQLRCGKLELELAKNALEKAQLNLNDKIEQLIEVDIEKSTLLLKSLELKEDHLSLSNINQVKEDISKVKTLVLESFNKEIELDLYKDDSFKTNKLYSVVKAKASLDLSKLQKENKVSDLNLEDPIINNDDHIDQYSRYGKVCLKRIKEELSLAEDNYNDMFDKLTKSLSLLAMHENHLVKSYNILDQKLWDMHWFSYNSAVNNINSNIESANNLLSDCDLFDIKLNPNFLGIKIYTELLRSQAELDNIKSISEVLARDINKNSNTFDNIYLNEMSSDNSGNPLDNSGSSSGLGSPDSTDSNNGSDKAIDGLSKSHEDIREILSSIEDKEITASQTDLFIDILQTFKELVETLEETDVNGVRNLLYKLLPSIIEDNSSKNKKIKEEINLILDLINGSQDNNEDAERQRINFDSYLIADDDLVIPSAHSTGKAGKVFRLLEVDNRLFVPTNTHIRVLVTSADVLHSWAVPSLGIKVDACPGRLNQVFLFVKREGVFYGQCSELCGVNHGFMPIVVQAVNQDDYLSWVGKRLCS
uniref:cytochrome-c oxidase n=1 Tax=Fucus distichus TaxID=3012 RepID=A0A343C636_FUCDI|nr:cytochrome c oxidase subunit 2 [Fucus distichus]ARI50039.1 cytochrome c oxidase subunit 2 [Fucus distichus]